MIRYALYIAIAAAIVGGAIFLNYRHDTGGIVRYHVDPQAAMSAPSHNHAITGTACECDPEAEIKQALADRADYARTHRELGDGFYERGRYEEALRCYERATEQDDGNAQAQYGLGRVYMKLARFDAARAAFERAVEADRGLVNGYISIGMSYYCQGDFEHARSQWEAALTIDPKNAYAKALIESLPKAEAGS